MQPLINKILWIIIGLNLLALVVAAVAFLVMSSGRNVDTMEAGWTTMLFVAALVVILLAALPLYFGRSTFSLVVSGFFALLPLMILLGFLISNHMPKLGRDKTMAELYYKDPVQRNIADAIEKGEVARVKQLIAGQDLNIQGNRVWDWDGLNYLQFAVRLRSNPGLDFQPDINATIIKMLVSAGSDTTPALSEAIKYLPKDMIALLLNAGADPNTHGFVNSDPLIFEAVGQTKEENDIAMLLIEKGAKFNVKNADGNTLLMFAANNAGNIESWADIWRVIRYLIEEKHADYTYKRPDGVCLASIVMKIREKAIKEQVNMPADFQAVVKILEENPEQTK